jgi:two-component system chemotaxis response regulator CheY
MSSTKLAFDRLRVLIIDDRKETRIMVKSMLGEMGITQIFEANDGREGLEFVDIAFDMIDIILCDWNMPQMDGLQLLQQIRSVNSEMPFLLITGRSDQQSVIEAKGAGVTAYIRKPFSLNHLEAKLRIVHQMSSIASN